VFYFKIAKIQKEYGSNYQNREKLFSIPNLSFISRIIAIFAVNITEAKEDSTLKIPKLQVNHRGRFLM